MTFRSLLIAIDLSPPSSMAITRAGLLPLAHGARLTLLHAVPRALPRKARVRAERDARKALAALARHIGHTAASKSIKVQTSVRIGAAADEIATEARVSAAELIVMGRHGGRAVRDLFLGSTAERVIRKGQLPVLVVRRPPHGRYRRPVLALDTDQAAPRVVALALRVIAPPRPRMEVVHAYEELYAGSMYPSLPTEQAREHRDFQRQKRLHDVARMVTAAEVKGSPPGELSWSPRVRLGSPRTVIPTAVAETRADLLILGTHGRAGLAHAFLGTVAGDVLREVRCDVLVVPP